ncbi:hypothetical protein LWI29_001413 [Acer saccharum]|uniref:Uncharacterized protein n=1 Tax=Acer saccharum TaxID=4024 RepID=A0AA39SQB6_ACESA|nr:hypothetical protein LWI29_001413 [Acer saccharum]
MLRRGERGCEGVVGLDDNGGCMWVYGGGATHEPQVSTWRWYWFVRKRRQMVKVQVLEREIGLLQAKDKLEKSMVADNESGKSIESEVRTSSGMFLSKAQVDNFLFP